MQPDDLARKILDGGFLTSKEVREAAGAPATAPARPSPPRAPRRWPVIAVGVAGVASIVTGVLLARSLRDEPAPVDQARTSQPRSADKDPIRYEVINPKPPDLDKLLAQADERLRADPRDQEALVLRAFALVKKMSRLPAGHQRDVADEQARNAAAQLFQVDPGNLIAADLLWSAHAEIRSKLAALGAPALPQRVQALATLREAMSQTLARNPSDDSCKKLVAAASLELGDAVSAAGQREKALELWQQAASLDASLLVEVERRKAGR